MRKFVAPIAALVFGLLTMGCELKSADQGAGFAAASPYGGLTAAAAAGIPSVAWSRDINAGGYIDGAPIGGFGAGTITMRYDGNFYKGRLNISDNDMTVDPNCGFYFYQKPAGQSATMKRLNAAALGTGQATYYALFPTSWVDYTGSAFTAKARVKQFSPIIPNDYQKTSYPVGVYLWEISNPTASPIDVAVMLAWNNEFSGSYAEAFNSLDNTGVILRRSGTGAATEMNQGEFTIASKAVSGVTVSYESATALSTLESDFTTSGSLKNTVGTHTKAGVSFKATLAPGQTITVPVVLSWDIPITKLGNKWYREYTRHFGRTGLNSSAIAAEALNNYQTWQASVDAWQNDILTNPKYPNWLKTTLFNELYYYFTGGTIWEAGAASGQPDNANEDMFSHLECYIYSFYGTSDVRFYGSWPLIMLWPELDKQAVKQFSDSVYNTRSDRPTALGTCAHDVGSIDNVFTKWNAYVYRDSTNWKDLNSKLVLMVYRAWLLTGKTDKAFLDYCWNSVQIAMNKVKSQDSDGDGLPNSSGIDQTYDDLSLTGNTAYCGSLFLAACLAAKEIAAAEGNTTLAAQYQSWYNTASANFNSKLWNGSYYKIDTGSANTSRIMSDQLCGQWYSKALGLGGIVPDNQALSAFTTIYNNNYKKFDSGQHGVVNVMLANGSIDNESSQAREMWVGTAWGVVAGMIQEGMTTQAAEIGNSLYNTIWNTANLQFRTPEAWTSGATATRASYYMRANAVWAVKYAYDIAGGVISSSSAVSISSSKSSVSSSSFSSARSSSSSQGVVFQVPGKIEAENYTAMSGIQTEACTEGTLNVGWIDAGDWMDYPINVPVNVAAASFVIDLRLASTASTGSIDVLLDNVKIASSAVPNTGGWQVWTTLTLPIALTSGAHTLRIYASGSPWNLNYLNITTSAVSSSSSSIKSSSSSSSSSIKSSSSASSKDGIGSIKIEAENYAAMSGVMTEACGEGTLDVGWIEAGDWMDYNVSVGAGSYTVAYRVASQFVTGKVDFIVNGTSYASTPIPNTGGWQTWTTVQTTVNLTGSANTIRLLAAGPSWNINYFTLTGEQVSSSSSIKSSSSKVSSSSSSLVSSSKSSSSTSSVIFSSSSSLSSVVTSSSSISSVSSVPSGLKVQFFNGSTALTSNQIYGRYKLVNNGNSSVALSTVKIRYYYTIDGAQSQTCWFDWASVGSGNVTSTFVSMNPVKTSADTYFEIGFTSAAGSLAPGASVELQSRIAKNNWANYTQSNDYSFNSTASAYADYNKVTAIQSGTLAWGIEP